jgi:integrase
MGDGRVVPIAAMKDRCVDAAYWLRRWLEVSGVKSGAVFVGTTRHGKTTGKRLTAQVVALIVKRTLARAGIASELFAAHSLRSGFVTSARAIGLDDHHTKNVSRHKTDKMLNHYDKRDSREAMAAISEAFNGQ